MTFGKASKLRRLRCQEVRAASTLSGGPWRFHVTRAVAKPRCTSQKFLPDGDR